MFERGRHTDVVIVFTSPQAFPDVQRREIRVHGDGSVSGRRSVDVAAGPGLFRRQRRVFRGRVRGRGAGLFARRGRGLQGPEAGEPVARRTGLREIGE